MKEIIESPPQIWSTFAANRLACRPPVAPHLAWGPRTAAHRRRLVSQAARWRHLAWPKMSEARKTPRRAAYMGDAEDVLDCASKLRCFGGP